MVKLDLYDAVVSEEDRIKYEKEGLNCISVFTFKNFLNKNKNEELFFNISTLGGDLGAGLTIHDLIKAHPKKTVANIIGLTASAGTVIAMGCDEITISENALFLVHNGWKGPITGNVYDFQKAASDLMKMDTVMENIYHDRTHLGIIKIRQLMKASDWLSATEAKKYGFVDQIISSDTKIAASALIAGAKDKITDLLLTKLEEKMAIFGGKGKETLNVLALKNGKNLLIKAEDVKKDVEVAPLAGMTLEDGEYELADGRKIIITGGIITEVVEESAETEASTAEIIAAVSAVVVTEVAKVKAEMETAFNAKLAGISSNHKPPKGGEHKGGNASAGNVHVNIGKITKGIHDKIKEAREV